VIPLILAFADLLLREPQILIFVMFGCFSLLVISDFGGLRRQRALAYLTATMVGAALVALGTLASSSAWLAVAVMFGVGLLISFSRVFGGYVATANTGMLLAFVIAVTIPAPAADIPLRIGGWAIACRTFPLLRCGRRLSTVCTAGRPTPKSAAVPWPWSWQASG
jgi:hypothetical protein